MLHVCRKCEFLVDGSINDFCQNCGANEWVSASSWPLGAHSATELDKSSEPSEFAQGCFAFFVWVFLIAAALGAL